MHTQTTLIDRVIESMEETLLVLIRDTHCHRCHNLLTPEELDENERDRQYFVDHGIEAPDDKVCDPCNRDAIHPDAWWGWLMDEHEQLQYLSEAIVRYTSTTK